MAALFIVSAGGWAVYLAFNAGSWWGPLHTFMIGGVLLAISGATQLFSTTWAAAIPPDHRIARVQRLLMATGAVAAIAGFVADSGVLIGVGATLVGMGLVVLAWILIGITRRSLLRRFGLSSRFYLLGIAAGTIGVTLGGLMGGGWAGSRYLDFRVTHMHLNVVGMVGFTIVGTLPTLLPTMARHKMVSGREATFGFWLSSLALGAMAMGALLGRGAVGVGCGLASVAAAVILIGIAVRLGIRRIGTSGLPALLVSSGSLWLIGWSAGRSVSLLGGGYGVWSQMTAAGIGGVALVLFGSLAYLIPVLVGPGSDLAGNFERMRANPWLRFVLANATVVAATAGLPGPVILALGLAFGLDYGTRVVLILIRERRRRAS